MKYAALVIALNEYDHNKNLTNALNDGRAMAEKFRELKYDVVELLEDKATYSGYVDAVSELMGMNAVEAYDAVILYFSGHGFMTDAADYLALKDCHKLEFNQGSSAMMKSVRVLDFIEKFQKRSVTSVVVILDACRDDISNYADADGGEIEQTKGVEDILTSKFGTAIQAPFQSFIAFSTTATKKASDGGKDSGHSKYTAALLEEIDKPVPIEQVFKNVRKKVHRTDQDQLPWEYSCLTDEFRFNYGQFDRYYGKLYPKDCYERENYNPFEPTIQKLYSLLLSKDESVIGNGLTALVGNRQRMNSEDLFVAGRIIMFQAVNGSVACKKFIEGRRLEGYKVAGGNDLVNGLLYELYFDSKNNYSQKKIPDMALLNALMQFSRNDYCSTSVDFINTELAAVEPKPFYTLGDGNFYSVYVELEKTDYISKDGSDIYYIEEIIYDDEDYKEEIDLEPYLLEPRDVRVELSRYFQIPPVLLRVRMNDAKHILKNAIPDRLEEILFDVLVSDPVDDIDQLCSSGYSPNDCMVTFLEDVQVEEDYMMIEGECHASFDLYFDDDTMSMSFPGKFSVELELEKGKWRNKSRNPFSFDTRKYYE